MLVAGGKLISLVETFVFTVSGRLSIEISGFDKSTIGGKRGFRGLIGKVFEARNELDEAIGSKTGRGKVTTASFKSTVSVTTKEFW